VLITFVPLYCMSASYPLAYILIPVVQNVWQTSSDEHKCMPAITIRKLADTCSSLCLPALHFSRCTCHLRHHISAPAVIVNMVCKHATECVRGVWRWRAGVTGAHGSVQCAARDTFSQASVQRVHSHRTHCHPTHSMLL
jgi:hypothetical protein